MHIQKHFNEMQFNIKCIEHPDDTVNYRVEMWVSLPLTLTHLIYSDPAFLDTVCYFVSC